MKTLAFGLLLFAIFGCTLAAQDISDAGVFHPNQRVTVPDLAPVTAPDASASTVAKAAVAILLSASKIQCDPSSHVENVAEEYAGPSLRTLAGKLSGASCTVEGRRIGITATFVPNGEIQGDNLIASLIAGKPLLMAWSTNLYVLYGVVYDETLHSDGSRVNSIRELLLIDPRYSDKRRLVVFRRESDDFTRVEGIAMIGVHRQ